ncbi:MAG: hypothetical protein EXR75_05490 [Myxococcales bacterium]|nr:hypothetical protein [Myxococcales bacterium]
MDARGLLLSSIVGVGLSLATPSSAAEPAAPGIDACAISFKQAQRHRKQVALLAARKELLACAQPHCPEAMQTQCLHWLDEVRRAIPSVLITATNHHGEDVADVRLMIDGAAVASLLDGTPRDLDPGPHDLRVSQGERSAKVRLIVEQGVQLRRVALRLPPPLVPRTVESNAGGLPFLSAVGFGVGAATAVVGTVTGALALVRASDLRDACEAGVCYEFQKDDFVATRAIAHASTASFALAGAAIASGIVGLFIGGSPAPKPASGSLTGRSFGLSSGGVAWQF